MRKVVGIDLGTTSARLAVIEGNEAKVIKNVEGERATPSIVAFTDGGCLTGQPAKRQAGTNPERTFFAVKRLIGRHYDDPMVERDKTHVPYKIVRAGNGDAWVEADGKSYSPSQISAFVLRQMKEAAESYLGQQVDEAVITVPACFNDAQRQAIKDAGKIAGLRVLRTIGASTAAALAYGVDRQKTGTIAIYDLGAGTFDISILEIGDGVFEVKSTNGDTLLGGEDFDNRIVDYLAEQFRKEYGIELRKNRSAIQRLKDAAEKAKIELSSSTQTEINLPFIATDQSGPKHLAIKLSRAKLDTLVDALIHKTIRTCEAALRDAGLHASDINNVVLVGSQTRMPKVQHMVRSFFGRDHDRSVNPEEIVVVGAAIQAGVLQGDVKGVLLLDVTPLSLGIEAPGGIFARIIDRNTNIPTKRSDTITTFEDHQTAITIRIFQGEQEMAADNLMLGKFDFIGIPPAPRGTPKIELTLDIDGNGTVNVQARDKATGKEQQIRIQASGGLSETDIRKMVKDAEAHSEVDKKRRAAVEAKNHAEALVHATEKALTEHGGKLGETERHAIEIAIADLKTALKGDDSTNITGKSNLLAQASMKLGEAIYKQTQEATTPPDSTAPKGTETSLHRNPFWVLWATTRDDRPRIVELADEKALVLDADVCQKACADLTHPRARLSAEVSWLPGASPTRAWQIATAVRGGFVDPMLDAGLPPLPRANILSAALEVLPVETSPKELAERVLALAQVAEEIDAGTVLRQINEDRSIARFPPVKGEDAVDEELVSRRRAYRNAVKDCLDRRPTEVLLNVMNDVVDRATGSGKHHAPIVIEELVDSFETEAQGFIQAEAKNLELLVERAKTKAKQGEPAVAPVVHAIRDVAVNWNRVVRPIQLISKARGIDHLQSRTLASQIRNLGVDLYNEHSMLAVAQTITDLLKNSFSVLPEFSEHVHNDVAFIEQALTAQNKSEEQKKEWEREITYSVEVGLVFKELLKISPNGVEWGSKRYPLESVTRIRWGGTRHSVNGIPTGTTYEIYIGDDRSEAVINLRRGEVYSTFIDKLWQAVGVRLMIEHLGRLKKGESIQFGDATIEDAGVVLQRHGAFWSTQPVRLTWYQVHVWTADGSFVLGAKDDKRVYVALSYLRIANVHVLEQMIRIFFKTGHPRLSSVLDR
jgi:molecular chaperone DnaK